MRTRTGPLGANAQHEARRTRRTGKSHAPNSVEDAWVEGSRLLLSGEEFQSVSSRCTGPFCDPVSASGVTDCGGAANQRTPVTPAPSTQRRDAWRLRLVSPINAWRLAAPPQEHTHLRDASVRRHRRRFERMLPVFSAQVTPGDRLGTV
jgi:hypothetical protein